MVTKGFLAALVFLAVGSSARAEGTETTVSLTEAERAYVAAAGPISMCVDPDWVPFERLNEKGEHEGIAADLVRLVAARVGLRVVPLPTANWDDSLKASQEGRCQIMSFLNQTPERERWLSFTKPIFLDPNIIITREEHPFIGDLHGLDGETVALPRGTMVTERIRALYPNLTVIPTGSEEESVSLVSDRKADITIRSLIVAAYAIRKEGLFNLKISGHVPEMTNALRIGVLKGEPLLRSILDKGVATLTPQEREAIANTHVAVKVQRGIDYGLIWEILAAASAALLVVVLWNRKLRKLNRELNRLSTTDRLTGLFNRLRIDELVLAEIARVDRFGGTFGLILLDVDHFKDVNDRHGHQVGDAVLVHLADALREGVRATDMVGRWGGEEFLILCPGTDGPGALTLAENLRGWVAGRTFPKVDRRTISLGVTTHRPGDSLDDMVARADAALYEAKRQGRNRAVLHPPQ
jgi:diguanylate cyclase (GGDEF)-like protein